jgi:hypothetical protein
MIKKSTGAAHSRDEPQRNADHLDKNTARGSDRQRYPQTMRLMVAESTLSPVIPRLPQQNSAAPQP